MSNSKFPNAEYVNYLCQVIINEQIYKIIQDNYLKNIINIERNQIIQEYTLLNVDDYNIVDKLILAKTLIRNAQNRASQILEGKVPEVLCTQKFKQKVFLEIFNESYYDAEKKILAAINFIFVQEIKKSNPSSIEEYHAALQYFISAGSNLAIDTLLIKSSLKKTLEKHLSNLQVPYFKENATIVGQAGKEIIKILQKGNALNYDEIIKLVNLKKPHKTLIKTAC